MLSGLPPPRGRDFQDRSGWSAWLLLAIPLLFAAGIAIRLAVLQSRGLVGDIDQFVLWVHGIAVNGWNRAYDQNLSFPAVMAWIWGGLAALEPAFRTVTDSSDPGIRSLMKVPATLADLGIAVAVVWWFRDRPKLAVLGGGGRAPVAGGLVRVGVVGPVRVDLRAVRGARAARGARSPAAGRGGAARGQPDDQAAGAPVPRAVRGVVPRDAGLARNAQGGDRGRRRRRACCGCRSSPPAARPTTSTTSPTYQNDIFGVLSLNAWNPWALLQVIGANGQFVSDRSLAFGPITLPARRVRARRRCSP